MTEPPVQPLPLPPEHPDDLVTLTKAPTEFQANVLVAVLREAGIDAIAFGTVTGASIGMGILPVPVQVRSADLERAKAALQQNVSDSVDLDWDEVDVGEREDQLPLIHRENAPLVAKIVAVLILLSIVLGILVLLWTALVAWH